MTAAERLEHERREAIRAARYEEFCLRTMQANVRAQEKSVRLLEDRLEKRRNRIQPQLDFAI